MLRKYVILKNGVVIYAILKKVAAPLPNISGSKRIVNKLDRFSSAKKFHC
jgi:hypothetical protein